MSESGFLKAKFVRRLTPRILNEDSVLLFHWGQVYFLFSKPFEKLRSSVDQIMVLHTKLIDIGGLHPDSEDELNLPLSTADKRASWTRRRSTRRSVSRTDSVSSTSSSATLPPKVRRASYSIISLVIWRSCEILFILIYP